MNLVTVIPARGGSKSIPFKNIKLLNGEPLISYSINYSLKCPLISHTVVSTDSDEICSIAKEFNAQVPFIRPVEISGDDVEDYPVIYHALNNIETIYGLRVDAIVWLRPTSPLRPPNLIERSMKILKSFPECSSIRSVIKSKEHPYRQWAQNGPFIEGVIQNKDINEPFNLPRQKLPDIYFQSGDIEVIKRETIIKGSISGDKVVPLIINQNEMLDIDHFDDLKIAEKKLFDDK
jgi:CMP-N,N'-diacetyllegionaminic acid synthase